MHIPYELTYLLPVKSTSDVTNNFLDGTITENTSINALLTSATRCAFISYDDIFARIVGSIVSAQLVAKRPGSGAIFEAGVYIPFLDEVWFTSTYGRYAISPCFRQLVPRILTHADTLILAI